MRIILSDRVKAILWWIVLAASIRFVVIGVDDFPHLICWMPMCVVFYFAMQSKAFKKSFNRFIDSVC